MKLSELQRLEEGGEIIHKRYGLCVIQEVTYSFGSFFGVIIRPKTESGKAHLMLDSRCDVPDFLESSLRTLKHPHR